MVFVGESAEDGFSVESVVGEVDRFWRLCFGLSRGELAQAAVRTRLVVVVEVGGQDGA